MKYEHIEDKISVMLEKIRGESVPKVIGRLAWQTAGRVVPLIDPVQEKERKSVVAPENVWVTKETKLRKSGRVSTRLIYPPHLRGAIIVPSLSVPPVFIPEFKTPDEKAAFEASFEDVPPPLGAESISNGVEE